MVLAQWYLCDTNAAVLQRLYPIDMIRESFRTLCHLAIFI